MSIYAKIVAFLVCLVISLGVGYRHGLEVKQGEWDASNVAESEAQDKALQAAAREIAKLDISSQIVKERVIRETVDRPVYRECVHSSRMLDNINAAIEGKSVDPVELPASGPSD